MSHIICRQGKETGILPNFFRLVVIDISCDGKKRKNKKDTNKYEIGYLHYIKYWWPDTAFHDKVNGSNINRHQRQLLSISSLILMITPTFYFNGYTAITGRKMGSSEL